MRRQAVRPDPMYSRLPSLRQAAHRVCWPLLSCPTMSVCAGVHHSLLGPFSLRPNDIAHSVCQRMAHCESAGCRLIGWRTVWFAQDIPALTQLHSQVDDAIKQAERTARNKPGCEDIPSKLNRTKLVLRSQVTTGHTADTPSTR
jgi:hypothetical protein